MGLVKVGEGVGPGREVSIVVGYTIVGLVKVGEGVGPGREVSILQVL